MGSDRFELQCSIKKFRNPKGSKNGNNCSASEKKKSAL